MKITEALLAEHIVFHHLFDYVEHAVPNLRTAAEVRAMATLLTAVLNAHSHTEETLLFEPIEHCLEQLGQTEPFHAEHHEIEASLVQATQESNAAKARRQLLAAVVASRKHFDKEERLIFPLAERVLKRETLQSMGKKWMQQRQATNVVSGPAGTTAVDQQPVGE